MSACIHAPVDVAGSLCSDGKGSLLKVQHCVFCGAQRRGVRMYVPEPLHRSSWEPWAFDDWKSIPKPDPRLVEAAAFFQGDEWPAGMVDESRRAGRQPVPQPSASDLLENREAALAHVKMLIAIHGFRPAELVPNGDEAETS